MFLTVNAISTDTGGTVPTALRNRPDGCLGAFDGYGQTANLEQEITLLKHPLAAVGAYECQVSGFEVECDGATLTRFELYLGEITQTLVVRYDRCNQVTAVEQDGLLAGYGTGVADIDRYGDYIIASELTAVNLEVGVIKGGVAEASIDCNCRKLFYLYWLLILEWQ